MTKLGRTVRRRVESGHVVAIELVGGVPMLAVREARRRTWQRIEVPRLYTMLCMRAADAARGRRRQQRRGGLLGRER